MQPRDVVIVGGGPAGLSAALVLGRCRRRVTLYDDDRARNRVSRGIHGFVSRDGVPPAEFRSIARAELSRYDVELRNARIVEAVQIPEGFRVQDEHGDHLVARKILLATGAQDELPRIPGTEELYGRGVYPCPYCDGWELRDRVLGAYAQGEESDEFALGLKTWSADVTLFTDGGEPPSEHGRARLARHGVRLCQERVAAFAGSERGLRSVVLAGGTEIACDAVFLHTGLLAVSPLARMLGIAPDEPGPLRTRSKQRSDVPGLYLAGDSVQDVKFAVVAAAHGARAAHDINRALRCEDLP